MLEFFLVLIIMLAAVAGMSVGLLRGRRVQGSCGGLNNVPGVESDCGGTCRKPCARRAEKLSQTES